MIIILKLAFCLRAIGVKTYRKTTVEILEGKKAPRPRVATTRREAQPEGRTWQQRLSIQDGEPGKRKAATA